MFGDLGKIMKLAGEMKRKMPEMKERLAAGEYTAQAGGGVVRATVNGKMQLVDLKLSEQLLANDDLSLDMLEDLIKAAVSAAQAQAAQAAQEAMKELTGGMDLPGLSDLM
ncbi:MAG: YbaB/EbfC family nucleoid-associated protein [Phycisphaerae bacterium]|nr:YbaB/EbfC family nucleoid-associated protein [Phycisphaerae bacterium]